MSLRDVLMRRLHRPVYESRLRVLTGAILPHLQPGDSVLDVGCGNGQLGAALRDHAEAPADLDVRGLERVQRGGEAIPVTAYDGHTIPLDDDAVDVVILADVLHHETDEDRLLSECLRVTRRLLIIKDHKPDGLLAQQRIALIDWAANAPYGVPCLYRYHTLAEWRQLAADHGVTLAAEQTAIDLYPPGYNLLFGRKLQFLAVWRKS